MVLIGKSAAPGFAVGRIHIHHNSFTIPKESLCPAGQEQLHLDRYFSVKLQAMHELELIIQKLNDSPEAAIFKAHKEIVDDIIINEEIPAKIKNEHWTGDWAIYSVYETVLNVLKKTPDPLIAERASDFNDVRSLLLRLWFASDPENLNIQGISAENKNEGLKTLAEPVIIAARELMPSDAVNMDKTRVKAILTEIGGLTSHAAIIAKNCGIPTVLGIANLLDSVKHGETAAVDASEGKVILDPDENQINDYQLKASKFEKDKKEEQTYFSKEGRTKCGIKIDIGLNIANADKDLEAEQYADSIGVFRTEYLFMERDTLPSEEEQYQAYKKVLECFKEKPVIIRTLDIGGDKHLSCMNMPSEENPFLGERALRFCFTHPGIFLTQIKALLRAACHGNLWVMFPMAGSIEDIRRAKEFVEKARENLKAEGKTASGFKLGIMIEIPSIALIADIAGREVDFASIGSNDLCQYLCASDRMNVNVEEYYQSYHPGMFRLIKDVISAFDSAGKSISICGELGADPLCVPLLLGLGLRKLSMNVLSIAQVKRVIAGITIKQCEELAEKVLHSSTAQEVKALLTANITNET